MAHVSWPAHTLLKLIFNVFVVFVGFLILSGAVNTAIIGSNGVLNRVSEDGVLTDWFRKPHRRFGTSYRIINLVVGLQLFTILVSARQCLYLWAKPMRSASSGASPSTALPCWCCASNTTASAAGRCRPIFRHRMG